MKFREPEKFRKKPDHVANSASVWSISKPAVAPWGISCMHRDTRLQLKTSLVEYSGDESLLLHRISHPVVDLLAFGIPWNLEKVIIEIQVGSILPFPWKSPHIKSNYFIAQSGSRAA